MYQSDLYKRVRAEVDRVSIVDTHEHLTHPWGLMWAGNIDFGRLFVHYASSDLVSAGMPQSDMAAVQDPNSPLTVRDKWRLLKPYYQLARNTGYCECIRIGIRDLYGIEDLTDDTVEPLSEKMNAVSRETWTREVFDRANIDLALEHGAYQQAVHTRDARPDLFIYDMVDGFSGFNVAALSEDTGIDVYNLDDYLGIIDWYFDTYSGQSSAFKIPRAYDRTLFFDEVPSHDARRIFGNLLNSTNGLPPRDEMQALEDFVIHHCIRKAGECDLPVKFHTGLQEGNCNDIRNSRAGLLINLFMKYPKTRFDIYHISWPYTEELINVCKNFANVYIDFCWAWIFNPPAARRYLSDMLETVPLNKIHGFGGDFIFVEGTYAHSQIARREIARVLTEKVQEGRFTEDFASYAAHRLLRENALENFAVERKRVCGRESGL